MEYLCATTPQSEVSLNIILDNTSGVPIYEQIYGCIADKIVQCELQQDELLPSIRNLAKDLRISVITTKRAYEELERDGYIYSVTGRGSYVSRIDRDSVIERRAEQVAQLLTSACNLAAKSHISTQQLTQLFNEAMRSVDLK